MRILIAGGAGYVGSVLVPKLLNRGYYVDVLDLLWFGNHLPENVTVIKKNIFDIEEKDLVDYDQVIFIGGISNDPMAEYSPSKNFVGNGAAPTYLAYVSKRAGVKKFIYGGSCSVYGYTVGKLSDESSKAVSNYPYGISKLQGEFGVLNMNGDGFSVISLRKGTVCGYSPRMRLDLVVNAMFKSAVVDNIIVVNNPTIWRPILSIQDAASAYIRAVEANIEISGIFNIASNNYTVGEIADYVNDGVKKCLGIHPKLEIRHIEDFRNYKVNINKAIEVLGFKPMVDVIGIVKNLADNVDKFKDMHNPNYYNIKIFKKVYKG